VTPLSHLLRERIAASGPLSVETFIAEALGHADFGYYRRRQPIGRDGDFITAPEISQVFGELIGLWAIAAWESMGSTDPLHLVELGPGRGQLLADALRAIGRTRPAALADLMVDLVEINPTLRERQREALASAGLSHPPAWWESFADVPHGPFLLIANEFFDALPIRQFVRADGAWRERMVGIDATGDGFVSTSGGTADLDLPETLVDCEEGDVVELCPAAEALGAAIASRIVGDGGAALILDYGHARPSFGDSLQAVRGHRIADPLADPGEVDLSHHVDFAALQRSAAAAGAATFGPVPQGLFLGRLGIDARAATLAAASPARATEIEGAVRRLVHPGRMGVLFKALAIAGPKLPPPPGFVPTSRRSA
jgi:Uncharacterized conserved protein